MLLILNDVCMPINRTNACVHVLDVCSVSSNFASELQFQHCVAHHYLWLLLFLYLKFLFKHVDHHHHHHNHTQCNPFIETMIRVLEGMETANHTHRGGCFQRDPFLKTHHTLVPMSSVLNLIQEFTVQKL